jgi:catechol 2,3-dioxygenase-like lactoylglutathione lyase family enzyme
VVELVRIRHVKLPVVDLARSVAWYRELLDMELVAEFREGGELRGAQLMDATGFGIALRDREHCAGRPDLTGFDVVALEVGSVDDLHRLDERAASLGGARSGVADRGPQGAYLDVTDPDGTVLRFLANNPINPGRFLGVDFDGQGSATFYDTPTLR